MLPRAIDIGERCPRCHQFVREDADGCLGCACDYEDEDDLDEEDDDGRPR